MKKTLLEGCASYCPFSILSAKPMLMILILSLNAFQIQADTVKKVESISLSFDNASLKEVFSDIEQKTNYRFFYSTKAIREAGTVSLNLSNVSVQTAVSALLDNFPGLTFKIEGDQIILKRTKKPGLLARGNESTGAVNEDSYADDEPSASAVGNPYIKPEITIRGIVKSEAGTPLPGVNIIQKGTTNGTTTDAEGKYSLTVIEDNAVLVFSFIGYMTQEVAVNGRSEIEIALAEDVQRLDEVVVVGYGTREKRDVTTSISTINKDQIEKLVPASPELLMQGQMSGVQVIGNQGNPSARPTVRIRGTNTWGISDPLYVIDGIPVKEYGAGIEGQADQYVRGYVNIMSLIDPNDIESISVLKDATAGAIYGVRAANGVVLITTKKGKKGTPTVTFSQRFAIQNVTKKLDVLTTREYADFMNALYASDPASSGSRNGLNYVFDPNDPGYLGNSPTYDWQSAVRNKNAPLQNYSVNVSGGSEGTDYFVSFGYSDQDGVNIHNNMKRYSGSIKLNVNVTDFLRVGINYRLSTQTGDDFSRSPVDVAQMPPWQPIYDANGINGYASAISGYDANGVWTGAKLYGNATGRNDLGYYSLRNHPISALRNMGNAYVELEPLDGLKFRATISIDKFDNSGRGGTQYIASYFSVDGADPAARGGTSSVGDYERRSIDNLNIIKEFSANYTKSIGNHNLDLLFNVMQQRYSVDNLNTYTVYVTSTDPNLIGLGGDNQYNSAISDMKRGALEGYLMRAGYNFSSKYYLDLTVRRDGSSRFAPENRWGTFPAASVAWRITKEPFMSSGKWPLDDLKLRAGWGKLGNQEVKDMAYLSSISTRPTYTWGNNPGNIGRGYANNGATVFGMPNRALEWESTSTINIGFDAAMFKQLSLSVEYYDKNTDGILQTLTLPSSVGLIEQPVGNVAKVRNSGVELNLGYNKSFGELNFSAGANFTTVRNRVVKLYGGIPMGNIEEGYSLFYIKGFQVDGKFQTDADVATWMATHNDLAYQNANIRAGDFYFKDLRGAPGAEDKFYSNQPDGVVDAYDQVYLGKVIPGYFYGFNFGLSYKSLDFNATFTGVGDVQKVSSVKSSLLNLSAEGATHTKDALNYWTPTNTDTSLPRLIWADPASNGRFSDFWVEDADYLRLANAQLGFTLPDVGIKNILRYARIYAGCSNLFTITKFSGFDPEDENNPAPLILYFGLNAKF
jgi:TonB-linked SusC/RagA family outer membrane protein